MKEHERNKDSQPLQEVIQKLLRAYQLEGKMKELDILEGWKDMMGIAVANRTKNLFIRNRVLHVTMDSSVMREELLNGKSIIIQRVNEFAGEQMIDDVWFD